MDIPFYSLVHKRKWEWENILCIHKKYLMVDPPPPLTTTLSKHMLWVGRLVSSDDF